MLVVSRLQGNHTGLPLRDKVDAMKGFIYGTLAVWVVMACVCLAAPEPAIVPGPRDWTVDVIFEHPQQIILHLSGEDEPRRFWYVIITLTNKTNRDVDFYPKCELMTDTFQITPAGKDTPEVVFEHIKRRHQVRYPFLKLWKGVTIRYFRARIIRRISLLFGRTLIRRPRI